MTGDIVSKENKKKKPNFFISWDRFYYAILAGLELQDLLAWLLPLQVLESNVCPTMMPGKDCVKSIDYKQLDIKKWS